MSEKRVVRTEVARSFKHGMTLFGVHCPARKAGCISNCINLEKLGHDRYVCHWFGCEVVVLATIGKGQKNARNS